MGEFEMRKFKDIIANLSESQQEELRQWRNKKNTFTYMGTLLIAVGTMMVTYSSVMMWVCKP